MVLALAVAGGHRKFRPQSKDSSSRRSYVITEERCSCLTLGESHAGFRCGVHALPPSRNKLFLCSLPRQNRLQPRPLDEPSRGSPQPNWAL